ncbi:hypothetical protein PTI98_009256 [Pleurotus ostreatus]|nr:hypothetical protein PTI98_009256 [Pleurotus ostreatus]
MYTVADIESIHYPCDLNANQRLSANHRQSIGSITMPYRTLQDAVYYVYDAQSPFVCPIRLKHVA